MSREEQLRNQVIHYFKAVGSGQNMIQCIKQVLFLHKQFNPVFLFDKLSKGKQHITPKNWQDYLISINLQFNQRQFKYFMKHNQYKSQITLNEFLESIIPYNGDVVRKYKQECQRSIKQNKSNKEIDYIFAELIQNQFKLFRILINVRDQISAISTLKDIQKLIKNDLLKYLQQNNLSRQHGKLLQTFHRKDFKLGFSQLRKFFQIKVPQKDILIHELCMLNIMRHLKSNDPFCKIIFKKKINENKNNRPSSGFKRSRSRSQKGDQTPQKNIYKRQDYNGQSPYSRHEIGRQDSRDKYSDFKQKMLNEFNETKNKSLLRQAAQSNKKQRVASSNKKASNQHPNDNKFVSSKQPYPKQPQFANITYEESKYSNKGANENSNKSLQGDYILKFFEEMITKQYQLETLRKQLAKNYDFNLINLYKLIDTKNKGFTSTKDIAQFAESSQTKFKDMVSFYGKQKDKLLFHEFCDIFRPLSKQLNEAIDSRPQNKIHDPFKKETKRLILQILNLEGQLHFNLQKMREGMRRINPKSMFSFLDIHNKGFLDSDSLITIFKNYDIYCDDKSLKCFMKLFRKRIEDRINFTEFVKFIEA